MNDFDYLGKQAERMQDLVRRLLASTAFRDSVSEIRSILKIDPTSPDQGFPIELQLAIAPHIQRLRKEYDLDLRWETFLSRYILWGREDEFMFGPITHGYTDEVTGKQVVSILVLADTRGEDLTQAYRQIAKYHRTEDRTAGYTGRRLDPYENLERDAQWYEWHKEGLSLRKIASQWGLENNEPEPNHTSVKQAIEKYEREVIHRK